MRKRRDGRSEVVILRECWWDLFWECEREAIFDHWMGGRKVKTWRLYLVSALRTVGWLWSMAVCRILGHRIKCESHITRESGCEELWCKRCGWSDTIIYY